MTDASREAQHDQRHQEEVRAGGNLLTVARNVEVPEIERYVNRRTTPLLVIISGPSGVGKDVTLQRMRELGYPFHYTVTATTRPIRPGEVDGLHYHFRTKDEFQRMREAGELLEEAEVYGNFYGVPKSEVLEHLARGEDVIVKPDVQGARSMRALVPNAIYIFLAPPSMDELEDRLRQRKTEDPAALERRLRIAREEMKALPEYEYVVVNQTDKLDECVEEIAAIMTAEKCRVNPRQISL